MSGEDPINVASRPVGDIQGKDGLEAIRTHVREPDPDRPPAIKEAQDLLETNLHAMEGALQELFTRLQPILGPENETQANLKQAIDSMSPVAAQLTQWAEKLAELTIQVTDIEHRVELG